MLRDSNYFVSLTTGSTFCYEMIAGRVFDTPDDLYSEVENDVAISDILSDW